MKIVTLSVIYGDLYTDTFLSIEKSFMVYENAEHINYVLHVAKELWKTQMVLCFVIDVGRAVKNKRHIMS